MFADNTHPAQADRQKLAGIWADEFDREVEKAREKEPDVTRWRTAGKKSKDKPNGEDVGWWRAAGLNMLNGYADWWAAGPPWRIWTLPDGEPAVEVPVLVPLNGVPVVGYIDQILQSTSDERLLIVDKKTGARKPPIPIQLAGYAVSAEAVFAQPMSWGAYYMARDAELTDPEPLSHWTPELLGSMYERMDRAERLGLYLPNVGSHCSGCLVRRWCPPAGGEEYKEEAAA